MRVYPQFLHRRYLWVNFLVRFKFLVNHKLDLNNCMNDQTSIVVKVRQQSCNKHGPVNIWYKTFEYYISQFNYILRFECLVDILAKLVQGD